MAVSCEVIKIESDEDGPEEKCVSTQVCDDDLVKSDYFKPGTSCKGVQVFGLIKEKRARLTTRSSFKGFSYYLETPKTKDAFLQVGNHNIERAQLDDKRRIRDIGIQVSSHKNTIETIIHPKLSQPFSSRYDQFVSELKRKERFSDALGFFGEAIIEIQKLVEVECQNCFPGKFIDHDEYVFERAHRKELTPRHPSSDEEGEEEDSSPKLKRIKNPDSDESFNTPTPSSSENGDWIECEICVLRSGIKEQLNVFTTYLPQLYDVYAKQ